MQVDDPSALAKGARYIAFGTEFAVSVVAGVIGGYYLDDYLGTAPLFTLLLTIAGMFGALYRLLWSLKKFNSQPRQ